MADRLVQQDAGPAGPEHDRHLAGRRRHRLELAQCRAQGLVNHAAPARRLEQIGIAEPAPRAETAALHARAVADHDADVEPDQGADVAAPDAVGAHDLHPLPRPAQRRADLLDARILGARVGVDLLQQPDLLGLVATLDRVVLAVTLAVGALGRQGERAGVAALDRLHGVDRAANRSLGQIAAVGIADRLAGDRAQAEAAAGV